MAELLCAFGVCFIMRGAFMFTGRTVPKTVISRLEDKEKLRGWCRGTGTVHVLWGICAVLIWCANRFEAAALAFLGGAIICAVVSVAVSLRTTAHYSNKEKKK